MKNERVYKSFSALSFDGTGVHGETAVATSLSPARVVCESLQDGLVSDQFREMLNQRLTTPCALAGLPPQWTLHE